MYFKVVKEFFLKDDYPLFTAYFHTPRRHLRDFKTLPYTKYFKYYFISFVRKKSIDNFAEIGVLANRILNTRCRRVFYVLCALLLEGKEKSGARRDTGGGLGAIQVVHPPKRWQSTLCSVIKHFPSNCHRSDHRR